MHPRQLIKFFVASSFAAVAICIASISNTAYAEISYDGFYFGGLGGIALTSDFSATIPGVGTGKVKYSNPFSSKTPYFGGIYLGYKNGPFRYEGEGIFMHSEYKSFTGSTPNFGGNTETFAGLINLIYDFDQSGSSHHMYLGIGGGYARIEDKVKTSITTVPKQNTSSFAAQAIVGYAYNFSATTAMGIDYRFFITTNKTNFDGENFQNHMLSLNGTYYFG